MTYYISRFKYYDNDTISLEERHRRLNKEMRFYHTNYQTISARLRIEYLNSKGERATILKYIDLKGKKFEFSKFNVKNDTLYADSSIIITDPDQYYLKLEAISDNESKVIACGYYNISNSVLNISEISPAGKNIGQYYFSKNQPNKLFYEIEIGVLSKISKLDSLPKTILNDTLFNNSFTSCFNVRKYPTKYSRETLSIIYTLGSRNWTHHYKLYMKHKMFYRDSYRYF
jgi:predicted  nucleic acid-binding Zn-ribbon protein